MYSITKITTLCAALFATVSAACPGPYPNHTSCEDRIQWMLSNWNTKPRYANSGVDGSRCSIQKYLHQCEPKYCPDTNAVSDLTCVDDEGPSDGNSEFVIVTHNLFWWNLFGQRGGDNFFPSFGRQGPYDIMLFQECDDPGRILRGLGLAETFGTTNGTASVYITYNRGLFDLLQDGYNVVGEDRQEQYYGKRYMVWARLNHKPTGKKVFVASTHGPLPVNTAPRGYADNIKGVAKSIVQAGDLVVLGGDFNNDDNSETVKELKNSYYPVLSEWVDHMFTNLKDSAQSPTIIRDTGSDHRGLKATFRI